MTFAYWCVLVGALMPFVWTISAKAGGKRKMMISENSAPRAFLDKLDGRQKRADWAQQNAFEAFPAFAAAVIIAQLSGGAEQTTINTLAGIWVLARFAYGIVYMADLATLRSLVWFVALGCVVGLFIAAA